MAVMKKTEIELDHRFDPRTCRHTMNGQVSVLHCHHYATLYTQLAEDCGMLDGRKLLTDVAEDAFREVLSSYYSTHGLDDVAQRIAIAEQYYAAAGLGKMRVLCAGPESCEVELLHSHVDAGWIKKWGKRDAPVNYITSGYIAGMLAAIWERPARSYSVVETAGIVAGAERSKFSAAAN